MNHVLNSPVWLSFLTAFALAVGSIYIKQARDQGATLFALCTMFAIPLMVVGGLSRSPMQVEGTGVKPVWLALLAGIAMGASYWTSYRAFSLPNGQVSLVTGVIGTYPAMALVLGLVFTGEGRKINFSWMAFGIAMVVAGVAIIVTRGQKTSL